MEDLCADVAVASEEALLLRPSNRIAPVVPAQGAHTTGLRMSTRLVLRHDYTIDLGLHMSTRLVLPHDYTIDLMLHMGTRLVLRHDYTTDLGLQMSTRGALVLTCARVTGVSASSACG